jgi:uncharacterized protein (DUF433 family)
MRINAGSHYGIIEVMTREISNRITVNPKQCGGYPCIRGMRIRVSDVIDLFANGLNAEQILEEMPDLEFEDLQAALQYASSRVNHAILVAA